MQRDLAKRAARRALRTWGLQRAVLRSANERQARHIANQKAFAFRTLSAYARFSEQVATVDDFSLRILLSRALSRWRMGAARRESAVGSERALGGGEHELARWLRSQQEAVLIQVVRFWHERAREERARDAKNSKRRRSWSPGVQMRDLIWGR